MNYIIEPLWLYLAPTLDALKCAALVPGCILAAIGIVVRFIAAVNAEYAPDDFDYITGKKLSRLLIPGIILTVIGILLPSEKTLYAILVARLATYDNAQWTLDAVKEAVDYLVSAIKGMH